jgi:hypothetical protein
MQLNLIILCLICTDIMDVSSNAAPNSSTTTQLPEKVTDALILQCVFIITAVDYSHRVLGF